MDKRVVLLLALCCWAAPSWADPQSLTCRVEPGGATLWDQDTHTQIGTATDGGVGTLQWQADTDGQKHYRIERPPFDTLDMTVWFDAPVNRWRVRLPTRDTLLDAALVIGLSRTVRLNADPANAAVYVDLEAANAGQVDGSLQVAGVAHRVERLEQGDHGVTIPNAWSPSQLYLAADGFETTILQIPPGGLDTDSAVYPPSPVHLQARYGWFSYPSVRVASGVVTVVALLGYGLWWKPRQRRQSDTVAQERSLLRDILAHRSVARAATAHPAGGTGLTDHVIKSELGQRYILMTLIGQGGMGSVYEGLPCSGVDRDPVAIKVMLQGRWQDPVALERFRREISLCARLSHPSVVKVLDWGLSEPQDTGHFVPFMVMERVYGNTLRQLLREASGPFAAPLVVGWLKDILRGLATAHAAGVVHRDIKPENLMVTSANRVKIMDFGVAHVESETELTSTSLAIGTPKYMSPEHFKARTVSPASDLYSLGVVAFELLAGGNPFEGEEPWQILARIFTEGPPDLRTQRPDLPPDLTNVIARMIKPELAERYQSAEAVLADLSALSP